MKFPDKKEIEVFSIIRRYMNYMMLDSSPNTMSDCAREIVGLFTPEKDVDIANGWTLESYSGNIKGLEDLRKDAVMRFLGWYTKDREQSLYDFWVACKQNIPFEQYVSEQYLLEPERGKDD